MAPKTKITPEIDRLLVGGNHLASALINILGAGEDKFPPYKTCTEDAAKVISNPIHLDLWIAWKHLMLFRDTVEREEEGHKKC